MANSSNSGNDVFDIRRIKRIIELMQENELTELDIQQSDMRIQLKRNAPVTLTSPLTHPVMAATTVPPMAVPAMTVPPMVVPATNSATTIPVVSDSAVVLQDEKNIQVIKSPMVGTFYAASKPDAPPFVKIGDIVHADTTVCIIEAMKVYNEIQAECSGKIIAVLAKNGETVEFGKPLFHVTKNEP
ncbi:MAG: acetyl-CoA carboxylase biotin carboxyl carrier protein [Planctomycetaceae bacterium]|jgi:acetyl-CoA carboxylase biotin carboxyl carrier protein|nr:acetyl-CoA carboxylase biotin carboxyl carrier protein [Planctomycetaceae bacterium]